jgi:phage terminase large subunit-like protein
MEYPELRRAIIAQARAFGAATVLIEDAASGASLLQDLRRELSCVRGCKPVGEKIMRMTPPSPRPASRCLTSMSAKPAP